MSDSFSVQIEDVDNGVTAVVIRGELDQATLPGARDAFDTVSSGDASVLLDLSACEFVDSSGLAAFVAFRDGVTASDGRGFAVCCPGSQVRRLLELTGLDRAIGVSDTRDGALAALRDGLSPDPA